MWLTEMQILFEDPHLIVAVKEPGVASQSDPRGGKNMMELLGAHTGAPVFCVHRLDSATGGVMVYAKTEQAAAALSALFSDHKVKKQYYALVPGEAGGGEMRDLLWHDRTLNKSFVVDGKRKGVKEALLSYATAAKADGVSLVDVTLFTGRTHQIRVQFASRGMPLLGDRKYGSRERCPLALWCRCLSFVHPVTGSAVTGECAPPEADPWTRVRWETPAANEKEGHG